MAVVSESFARQQYPGQDPIGRSFGFAGAVRTIVGVVGDIRFRGLERNDSEPQVYLAAFAATRWPGRVLRAAGSDHPHVGAAGDADAGGARDHQEGRSAAADHQHADARGGGRRSRPRRAWCSCACSARFAVAAFLLAAIGIHGLLAFTVAARSREIGVRIALGAKARDIMWMVMGRSTTLAIIGVSVGAVLAYAAGRSMQALLFGVDPADAARLRRRDRAVAADGARRQPRPRLARGPRRSDDGDPSGLAKASTQNTEHLEACSARSKVSSVFLCFRVSVYVCPDYATLRNRLR